MIPETAAMFPKLGTVTAAVTPAEKPPVTAQKESTVVYMIDNADSQADAGNDSYWRTQRARICACAVVLTTLILVAGTLAGIFIVLSHTKGVETMDPHPSLNHDREPLLSNEVPLPKLPESTIRIKIDDGGLIPPTEPTNPDLITIDDVTDVVSGDDQEGDYGSAESDLAMTDGLHAPGPESMYIASSSSRSSSSSSSSSSNGSGDSSSSYSEPYYVSE